MIIDYDLKGKRSWLVISRVMVLLYFVSIVV